MKVAVFICGQPRLIDKSLLNMLKEQGIDYDVYIHYWKNASSYSKKLCGEINNNNLINNPNLENILIQHYSPTKIKGEIEPNLETLTIYDDCPDKNINIKVPQLCSLSIKRAFELCENPSKYDWMIKTRFDLIFPIIPNVKLINTMAFNIRTLKDRNICVKNSKNKKIHLDFTKCSYDKVNFTNILERNGEPMPDLWIIKPIPKLLTLFNYYDELKNCGGHPANEPILYNFCKNNNIELHSLKMHIALNRLYNDKNKYIFN
jgi:hypothetical protein